ncbi:hypothetical protein [Pseudoalteromonas luteoviolacea]|uniref:CBS domain-containing protein n=1 Tax=Pseudoalteromonas luteoviolacea S4060-1 TaxID=1365257 RepID=A0A161YFL8_9GAMM|nr:hypothetical protein [Pseudoalteromonas luteoviolacea]KZN33307.1 hypothetical protein N480_24045 [Pseudoalteromonas luteoviolacea S2607]KZN59106.1 hypothetical protein N478_08745 [Pseudoalteromonas luteoviolacea S4060-1]
MSYYRALETNAVNTDAVAKTNSNVMTAIASGEVQEQLPAEQFLHPLPTTEVDQYATIDEVLLILDKTHQATALVIDMNGLHLGFISMAQLGSRFILAKAQALGCKRNELTVSDVMVPLTALRQISTSQVLNARVGDIMATMEEDGLAYLLVVGQQASAVGYFDFIDMVKSSSRTITALKSSSAFKDVVESVLHHREM